MRFIALILLLLPDLAWPCSIGVQGNKFIKWGVTLASPSVDYYVHPSAAAYETWADEAMTAWQDVPTAFIAFNKVGAPTTNGITITIADTEKAQAGGESHVTMGDDDKIITNCEARVSPSVTEEDGIRGTIAHEVGHCLGLAHSIINGAIMSYRGTYVMTDDDRYSLTLHYPNDGVSLPPGCGAVASVPGQAPTGPAWFTYLLTLLLVWGIRTLLKRSIA